MTSPPAPAASRALMLSMFFDSEHAPTTRGLASGIPIYVVFKSAMVHLSLRREPATIRRKANAGSNATHLSVFVDAVNYASVSSQLTEFGDSLWLGGILTMSVEKPRFRRDFAAAPVEVDGERYVEVRDPRTGGSFLFYDFEYRVALAFD